MANYEYVVETGLLVPDTATLLEEVKDEWREAYGADVILEPETSQGVIVVQDTEIRDATVRNNVAVANQINPDYAGGPFLDAIWALTRGSRKGATRSTISGVTLAGQTGTTVPAGSVAVVTASGARFFTTTAVVIGETVPGVATVDFIAEDYGPIGVLAGGLNAVASGVLGWETVSNPNPAVPGKLAESDIAGRRRRRLTLALQSVAMPEAIISGLYAIEEIESLQFRENIEPTTQVIDGISLQAHSIWVCVRGGSNAQIAQSLLETKGIGGGYNGAVSVSVVEPSSGQIYVIKFDRPTPVTLFVRITAKFNNTDGATIIPNAAMAYATGEIEGDAGLIVGASVSPWEFAGAVNQVEPRIKVTKVELSTDGITWNSNVLAIALNQQADLTIARVLVVAV
jgi:Uncharacterized homolog of phage Mu protein gp47